jgi:hypothetical protein
MPDPLLVVVLDCEVHPDGSEHVVCRGVYPPGSHLPPKREPPEVRRSVRSTAPVVPGRPLSETLFRFVLPEQKQQ